MRHDYAVQFTLKSTNSKTGPMPVSTTARKTCATSCPFMNNGCYFESGPGSVMWRALSSATPGTTYDLPRGKGVALSWAQFCTKVEQLPIGTIWRHDQGGDLPGIGDAIDARALAKLVKANRERRGFTYTHKPVLDSNHATINKAAIQHANKHGLTINLSGNNLSHADRLADLDIGPVVVALPASVHGNTEIHTPAGRRVVVCPATYREDVACTSCQLCQRQKRKTIVGFPAHGASKAKVSAIAAA